MLKNLLYSVFGLLLFAGIVGSFTNVASSNESGAPTGNTGSPADNKTCAQIGCHPSPATAITGVITSDVPITGYVPGDTYTITATVNDPAKVKFGFEISPQANNGTLLGTMALLDATKTKFTSSSNKYITHKNAGTSWPNHTATWNFSWTAPVAGTGDVTFYGAFNFANNNGNSSGDIIHTATLTIPESFGVGIAEVESTGAFTIYPNPATDRVNLQYPVEKTQRVAISIYDLSGKLISKSFDSDETPGLHHQEIAVNDFPKGIYLVQVIKDGQSFSRKLVKQ